VFSSDSVRRTGSDDSGWLPTRDADEFRRPTHSDAEASDYSRGGRSEASIRRAEPAACWRAHSTTRGTDMNDSLRAPSARTGTTARTRSLSLGAVLAATVLSTAVFAVAAPPPAARAATRPTVATWQELASAAPAPAAPTSAIVTGVRDAASVTALVSRQRPATASELLADAGLTATDGTTIAAASRVRPISRGSWTQTMVGTFHAWTEVHKGTFYFDGKHVWQKRYRGQEGSHRCGLGYVIGGVVEVKECTKIRDVRMSTRVIGNWDVFRVTGVWHGFPLSHTHWMHIAMYPNGRTLAFYSK
jgi:hypothetical protein